MAWNKQKVAAFKAAFYDFLKYVKVDSKDTGGLQSLRLYGAQQRFLDGVFDGLENDIHHFVVLKARQLGISTISYLLTLFYASVFPGIQGAIIFDTQGNRDKFRTLLMRAIESLPASHEMKMTRNTRDGLVFANGSSLDFMTAGIKKGKGSGGLGRSRALNFVHSTECSSWADPEGLESLQASMSEKYENRLYIYESTARGYNIFHQMWEEAKADDLHRRAIFIGWWAKEDYSFAMGTPEYERYSARPISQDEQSVIDEVYEQYGVNLTMEQWSWLRYKLDPRASNDNDDAKISLKDPGTVRQEFPSTESEAFRLTGSSFFPGELLHQAAIKAYPCSYKGYRYMMTDNFLATTLLPVNSASEAKLKVWDEPDPNGVYILAADPAFGSSDDADRYVATMLRCYADGLEQVAEFCDVKIAPYQFTWVLAHMAGAYGNCRLILEINGPGEAVLTEFRNLKTLLETGYLKQQADEMGLKSVMNNVRHYMYHRVDSLGGGYCLHWKTTQQLKRKAFDQLYNELHMGHLWIKSMECLDEMKSIVEDGLTVRGEGVNKDDRAMAMAMAVAAWHDSERKMLIAQKRTRDIEMKKDDLTIQDLNAIFNESLVQNFFSEKQAERARLARQARRGGRWRW